MTQEIDDIETMESEQRCYNGNCSDTEQIISSQQGKLKIFLRKKYIGGCCILVLVAVIIVIIIKYVK